MKRLKSIGRQWRTSAALLATLAAAAPLSAQNLVTNGDFEAGNTGFSSDYTYSPGNGFPAATYTVVDDPKAFNSFFVSAGDHTTGDGLMLVANGSSNINDAVWQSTVIPISAATDYFFEAFLMNVFPDSPPILSFTVSLNGAPETLLATLGIPTGTGVWNGLSTTFNSGLATSATLYLRNAQTAFSGNDFALDDVYLGTTSIVNPPVGGVPEPSAWAMMILGFGVIGASIRHRRASVRHAFA